MADKEQCEKCGAWKYIGQDDWCHCDFKEQKALVDKLEDTKRIQSNDLKMKISIILDLEEQRDKLIIVNGKEKKRADEEIQRNKDLGKLHVKLMNKHVILGKLMDEYRVMTESERVKREIQRAEKAKARIKELESK